MLSVSQHQRSQAIEQADVLGDKDTADICIEISRGVDKYLWFVEAHLG
jgi:starvation-inducible DNA-binding protein